MIDPMLICRDPKGWDLFTLSKTCIRQIIIMAMMGVTTSYTIIPCILYRCGAINTKTKENLQNKKM